MATFDEFYASLDADSNIRGDQFEKIFVPWFFKKDPIWASQIEGVWLWDDYPKRSEWGPDNGVDIILHHSNGERWAVQAKCFSPDNPLKKEELNSFIADASDDRFQEKLLISSTNKIGPNADRLLKRHKVIRVLLKDLRDSNLNFPSSIENLKKVKQVEKYKPKPHQEDAINDVITGLNDVNKGQVIMACGSGKTLTSLWIKERLSSENTLVLVPSLGLLRQTVKNWNAHQRKTFKWLCVCSDNTVAKDKKNKDQWITNTSDLGISVTSDLSKIKEFLSISGSKVIFSTYQSSGLICKVQKIMPEFSFDLTIADEAHNCTGRVETYFGNILDDKKIRTNKKLFFTATPKILSQRIKKRSIEKEIEVASMDDKSKFGEVLHRLKFSDAIQKGILSDYQVAIIGVDNKEISRMIKVRDLIRTYENYNFDSESLATFIAVIKSIKNYNLRKLISFHNLIDHANVFSQIFPIIPKFLEKDFIDKLDFTSDYVEGKMSSTLKDEKIQKLKSVGKKSCFVLSNARCLSEGVDVPSLDGVAFIDPKHSPIDIVQAVGRAIRKSDEKTKGTIIIPVFLDEIDNIDEQVLASKFATVWSVITALKSQDDELLEKIDNLRIQLGSRKITKVTSKGFEKIYFDLPENINPKFYDSLYTVLIENTSDDWLQMYGDLKRFLKDNMNRYPLQKTSILGTWVSNQRTRYNQNKLNKERIELLNKINFIWDPNDYLWLLRYKELIDYLQNNNNTYPIKGTLSKWVQRQRYNKRQKNYKRLTPKRIKLLDKINFIWDPLNDYWDENFALMQKFFKENKHSDISAHDPILGGFVSSLRSSFRDGKISQERINLLKKIDFKWNFRKDTWNDNYKKLKDYFIKNGHSCPYDNPELNKWVSYTRGRIKNKSLTKGQLKLLSEIDFQNDYLEYKWYEKYRELKEYYRKNGNSNPPKKITSLNNWIARQRKSFREKKLSKVKQELLNKIQFDWNRLDSDWEMYYQQLKFCFIKNKTNIIPAKETKLTSWAYRQRKKYQLKTLTPQQIQLLKDIDFKFIIEDEWTKKYFSLKEFFLKNDNAEPTFKDDLQLYTWMLKQKNLFQKKKLSDEKIKKLNEIKINWNIKNNKWKEDDWEDKFLTLKNLIIKNGLDILLDKDFKLKTWVSTQRSLKNSNKLSEERINKLDEISFIWNPFEYKWNINILNLKEYIVKEKSIKNLKKKNPILYYWYVRQIKKIRNNELDIIKKNSFKKVVNI